MDESRVLSKSTFNLNGFTCSFGGCQFISQKQSRLKLHENTHTSERPYKCTNTDCSKEYKQSAHLKRHVDSAHNATDTKLFKCERTGCTKVYNSVYSLKKHVLRLHTNLRNYVCTTEGCEETFTKRFQLRQHIMFEHKGALPFQCHHEYCKRQFDQTSHLKRHLKVHEGYNCEVVDCGMHFDKWSSLRKHNAQCHKPVQKCVTCAKVCSSKFLLKRHITIEHSSDGCVQLFKCPRDFCTRSYPDLSNLNIHIKSYHDPSPFVCFHADCGKTLSSKQKLNQHVRQHDVGYVQPQKKPRLNLHRKKSAIDKLFKVDKCSELSTTQVQKEAPNRSSNPVTTCVGNDDSVALRTCHVELVDVLSSEFNMVLGSSHSGLKCSGSDIGEVDQHELDTSKGRSLVEKSPSGNDERCLVAREHIANESHETNRGENAASERNI